MSLSSGQEKWSGWRVIGLGISTFLSIRRKSICTYVSVECRTICTENTLKNVRGEEVVYRVGCWLDVVVVKVFAFVDGISKSTTYTKGRTTDSPRTSQCCI